ncbi:MAG: hypothetical protein PHE27_05940 [Alphaproteobacteria bacterium]|nr:hypothetical protein [Alphaproteobacteria bacterium]
MIKKNRKNYKAEIDSILKKIEKDPQENSSLVMRSSGLPAKTALYYNPYELIDIYRDPLARAIKTSFGKTALDTPENDETYRKTAERAIRDEFNYEAKDGLVIKGGFAPIGTGALSVAAAATGLIFGIHPFAAACAGLGGLSISFLVFAKAASDSSDIEEMFRREKRALNYATDPTTIEGNKAIYKRAEHNVKKIIAGKKKMRENAL